MIQSLGKGSLPRPTATVGAYEDQALLGRLRWNIGRASLAVATEQQVEFGYIFKKAAACAGLRSVLMAWADVQVVGNPSLSLYI